jgi:hypothetical protein
MSRLKYRVGNERDREAAAELSGGDLEGKDFRQYKRAQNKQDRVNRRAKRKAKRRGDQIIDGYEGYKQYNAQEQNADRYFDELGKKRTRNIAAGTALAVGTVATAGALGAFAGAGAAGTGGTTAVSGLLSGLSAAPGAAGVAGAGTTAATTAGTTALSTGAKILQGAQKVKKVVDTVKPVVDVGMDIYKTLKPEPIALPEVPMEDNSQLSYGFDPNIGGAVNSGGPQYQQPQGMYYSNSYYPG